MAGYAPHTRQGLIALIAMRRIKAETLRRQKLAEAKAGAETEALEDAGLKAKRSGWFRR